MKHAGTPYRLAHACGRTSIPIRALLPLTSNDPRLGSAAIKLVPQKGKNPVTGKGKFMTRKLVGKLVALHPGTRFGRWTVVKQGEWKVFLDKRGKQHRAACWTVVCECGTTRQVDGRSLRSGNSKSCGCAQIQNARRIFNEYTGRMAALGRVVKDTAGRYQKLFPPAGSEVVIPIACAGTEGQTVTTRESPPGAV
jgi:hypothetical protein